MRLNEEFYSFAVPSNTRFAADALAVALRDALHKDGHLTLANEGDKLVLTFEFLTKRNK